MKLITLHIERKRLSSIGYDDVAMNITVYRTIMIIISVPKETNPEPVQ